MRCIPVLLAVVASACGHAGRAANQAAASDGSRPIDEKRYVQIGGIEQWITIKGAHRDNPIILFLHGGPGDAWSPFAEYTFGPAWREHFTVVQWDQRGSGRTYAKHGPAIASTMTIERMVQDGNEVAQFLETELHQKKIIALGGSWGSMLGALMVTARPELYCAYVGLAQIVSMQRTLEASYPRVLAAARAAGDRTAIDELTAIGPPPWSSLKSAMTTMRRSSMFEPKSTLFAVEISPEYATTADRANWRAAEDFAITHLVGPALDGPVMKVDLSTVATRFEVPVFMIQGGKDLKAVPEVTKAYFDQLAAPRKQFVVDPESGHEPTAGELELMLKTLTDQVAPLCRP